MKYTFTDPEMLEVDKNWPVGQLAEVQEGGNIVIAGGYKGLYLRYLKEMFPKSVFHVFEPQSEMFIELSSLSAENIHCYPVALGTAQREMQMGQYRTDGASLYDVSGETKHANVVDVAGVIHRIGFVDLLVLNAEGTEWSIIPYILDEMMHHRIRTMAVQFHTKFVSEKRAKFVVKYIKQYYNCFYYEYPRWTYWVRR